MVSSRFRTRLARPQAVQARVQKKGQKWAGDFDGLNDYCTTGVIGPPVTGWSEIHTCLLRIRTPSDPSTFSEYPFSIYRDANNLIYWIRQNAVPRYYLQIIVAGVTSNAFHLRSAPGNCDTLVWTRDGAGNARIFINGEFYVQVNRPGNINPDRINFGASGAPGGFAECRIVEACFLNTALTDAEVVNISAPSFDLDRIPGNIKVSRWVFGDDSRDDFTGGGTLIYDRWGTLNLAPTNMAAADREYNPVGNTPKHCIWFDEANNYLYRPTGLASFPANFTVEGWAFREPTAAPIDRFWTHYNAAATDQFAIYQNAANVTLIIDPPGAGPLTINGGGLLTGWHHLAGTYNGGQCYLYIDGTQYGPVNNPGTGVVPCDRVRIGANASATSLWKGFMSRVAVYSNPLTQPEIAAIAANPLFVPQSRADCYLDLDFNNPATDVTAAGGIKDQLGGQNFNPIGFSANDYCWGSHPGCY